MCLRVPGQPKRLILERHHTRDGTLVETYTFALGKVTEFRTGEHRSQRGFTYPIGQTVFDSNARVGDHENGLHFIADHANARLMDSFGSHRLAVLPAPQLWDLPVESGEQPRRRCWHSSGATTLFCIDCLGLKLEELNNPEFWDSQIINLRQHSTSRKTINADVVLSLLRNLLWLKQRKVAPQIA